MRNLILGTVRDYSFEDIRLFVVSLRKTSFQGDLILFWSNLSSETRVALEQYGVRLVHFNFRRRSGCLNSWSRFWPYIRPVVNGPCGNQFRKFVYLKILNLAFVRYLHYLEFLKLNADKYNNVLLTDVRDVIFQDDPFRDPLPAELVAFLESAKFIYGSEPINDTWIRQNYDQKTLDNLAGHRISCCGTVMGKSSAMLDYLRGFLAEIQKLTSIEHGADTSIHNVLVRNMLSQRFGIADNLAGAVATLGNEPFENLKFSANGQLLGKDGRIVPVIHKYGGIQTSRWI